MVALCRALLSPEVRVAMPPAPSPQVRFPASFQGRGPSSGKPVLILYQVMYMGLQAISLSARGAGELSPAAGSALGLTLLPRSSFLLLLHPDCTHAREPSCPKNRKGDDSGLTAAQRSSGTFLLEQPRESVLFLSSFMETRHETGFS